ncbi:protein DDI1 homolog 2 isoform X3 [Sphaeramia orbicularis]|uniref:protein DDI1 homolog 2 isoform X3 n=1 Tax=Sphaeramia orbicularis TaxID=375764 RepID=UPI00117C97C5|nr:protein DDI1 homolog 2 isoform X3 [Sphaeramia orbicularis]XP_029990451.1 protein DDI1 homolog 2 isoform X3 [Sphaeramia orbicularis]
MHWETAGEGPTNQNPSLDRSQSAPAAMEQASAPGRCQNQSEIQEPPQPSSIPEDAIPPPLQVQTHPLSERSDFKVPPETSPSVEVLPVCPRPEDMATSSSLTLQNPESEAQPEITKGDAESEEVVNSPMLLQPEELSPIQPMEQEAAESDAVDGTEICVSTPNQSDSVEMESPPPCQNLVSSERDQPEGERCSSSDSIPSLAAALIELHELLVSNNCAQSQNRSSSCSPSLPFRQDTNEVAPDPRTPTPENPQIDPSTAITTGAEPSNAKANHAAVVSDEGPSTCLLPDLCVQDEHLGVDTAETVEVQEPPQCPDVSGEEWGTDRCGQDEANNISICQPEPEVSPDPAGQLEFREPPEGQQGRGVADGRASGNNTPDAVGPQTEHSFLSPLSMAVGSPEELQSTSPSTPPPAQAPHPTSPAPLLPAPHPFIEQFPAEHIQRIQAAGFSAREAAEALEQAHGVVELALLALLARSITVPT